MQILMAILSVIGGLVLSFFVYWILNFLVEMLPTKPKKILLPYVFIGPVLVLLGAFLIYPTIRTLVFSFMDKKSKNFVGLDNYLALFGDAAFGEVLINNVLWILIVPVTAVVFGLVAATLANDVGPTREKIFKSSIFLPMAISFVAAATIWRFMYSYEAPGQKQTGLLNAIWTSLTGGDPQPWMTLGDSNLNDLLIMVAVIWLNTGFAMVLLSAAIKGVPEETIEAARVDGASNMQIFWQVTIPQIWGTVVAVFITILIGVMKIFDIVYAMTSGDFGTSVLGMEFIRQFYEYGHAGRASAVVIVLMIAILPIMIYQVRTYRRQEALR